MRWQWARPVAPISLAVQPAGDTLAPKSNRVSPMDGPSSTFAWGNVLEDFALFRTLSSEQRRKAVRAMVRQDLVRGQMLVAQGEPSDALFVVLHGALAVRKSGDPAPIAELRAGELVGEIGFFANVPRTADVIAIRDTSVLVLTRAAYQELAEHAPAIVEAVLAALARRFARETARLTPLRASPKARTVALIQGGYEPFPEAFDRRMRDGLAATDAEIVDPARLAPCFPARTGFARSHRLAQQDRADRAAGGLSRRPRGIGLDAQGDPPGRHGRVRAAARRPRVR